jgi:hypothetical protein
MLSPVDASRRLLAHLRDAWNHEQAGATTAPVHPPLQSVKLIDSRFVDLLELMMRGSCRIQDTAELRHLPLGVSKSTLTLCGFSESSQQETLALVQITRQKVGIVHYANCFTSLFQ